jgi:hypothetical protein
VGESRVAYRVLVGKPEGRRPLGRPRRRWGIILQLILGKWGGEHELDQSGSGQGQVVGSCEHGNESLAAIKFREFLE